VLGRALRTTLVCDAGHPRNARSHAVHGFLTRDGMPPAELRAVARAQLAPYEKVEVRDTLVLEVRRAAAGFAFTLEGGVQGICRKVLLATGVVDEVPAVDGLDALYGTSVFHCPYCDGWEVRGRALAVLGGGSHAVGLALELLAWSRDVVLCTHGPSPLADGDRADLAAAGIAVREERVARLVGEGGALREVVFTEGPSLAREALFFCTGNRQASALATKLGCALDEKGAVVTRDVACTDVPGVFVAGDSSRLAQMVVVAAAEGALAAMAIHHELAAEDLPKPGRPSPR
jgi:thioredoxin reductase